MPCYPEQLIKIGREIFNIGIQSKAMCFGGWVRDELRRKYCEEQFQKDEGLPSEMYEDFVHEESADRMMISNDLDMLISFKNLPKFKENLEKKGCFTVKVTELQNGYFITGLDHHKYEVSFKDQFMQNLIFGKKIGCISIDVLTCQDFNKGFEILMGNQDFQCNSLFRSGINQQIRVNHKQFGLKSIFHCNESERMYLDLLNSEKVLIVLKQIQEKIAVVSPNVNGSFRWYRVEKMLHKGYTVKSNDFSIGAPQKNQEGSCFCGQEFKEYDTIVRHLKCQNSTHSTCFKKWILTGEGERVSRCTSCQEPIHQDPIYLSILPQKQPEIQSSDADSVDYQSGSENDQQ